MKKKRVYRDDGSWFHENVRPARQTMNRKAKAEAVARRKAEAKAADK